MTAPSPKYQALVWGGLGLVVVIITLAFVKTSLVGKPLPVYGSVPSFHLTNQLEQPVTEQTFRGHPWVCDVIFSTCPSQCLRMSELMSQIQKALPNDTSVRLVSLTAYPEFDGPQVLKKYGDRFGADANKWLFLTGTKSDINHLAASGLKFVVAEKKPSERDSENDLFIHTTKFVLLDKAGRIRGWYNSEDSGSLKTILAALKNLSDEAPISP